MVGIITMLKMESWLLSLQRWIAQSKLLRAVHSRNMNMKMGWEAEDENLSEIPMKLPK